MGSDRPPLIRALLRPEAYPHPVAAVRVVETHISWVLLTGAFAYKLKKPLDLGFLDFSTFERRAHACREELRLNRRVAPELYLGLVAITGGPDAPVLHDDPPPAGGAGEPLEYAVRMREFPQEEQLDRLLASGDLPDDDFDALLEDFAGRLAEFHDAAGVAGDDARWGDPSAVWAPVHENFIQLARLATDSERVPLDALRAWTEAEHARLVPVFAARKAQGRVRECHGDLHLTNLVRVDGRVVAFDCLEFDPALRWCDVASEVAFLFMDLESRARHVSAWRFLTAYLQACGDYGVGRVLRYYRLYRTMVRAKVAAIRRDQGSDDAVVAAANEKLRLHEELGGRLVAETAPRLVLMSGVSGAGKTWLSSRLGPRIGAIRVRSDLERKRLHGLGPLEPSGSALDAGIYDSAADERTYTRLERCADDLLAGGITALVDASFLRRETRARLAAVAEGNGVPCVVVECHAAESVLRERVARRAAEGHDASEAEVDVLARQLATREPVDAIEGLRVITVDTGVPVDVAILAERVVGSPSPR